MTGSTVPRLLLLLMAVWLPASAAAGIQGPSGVSRRPRLPAGTDSNDPKAYLDLANRLLLGDPHGNLPAAESAFVWAARLAPGLAAPLYNRGLAILRPIIHDAFVDHANPARRLRERLSVQQRRMVDSLLREAWIREPFLDPQLDVSLMFGLPPPRALSNPEMRGVASFFYGMIPDAIAWWGKVLDREPSRLDLRFHRAFAYSRLNQFDSAAVELERAVAAIGATDSTQIIRLAPPRDMFYYAIGAAREETGDYAGARTAYTQALTENLGLYMVHLRLAHVLLAEGDTTGGLTELSIAVGVAPDDPWLRNYYGFALLLTGRNHEALEQLQVAIAADSDFATPYYLLGRTFEALGHGREALSGYRAYLARAKVDDAHWAWTTIRVGELGVLLADSAAYDH